ncbi:uncharacterized protein LOC114408320 [Glycine soja]|uniref:uncharacterized protein LOC114408320 n=1 Tax=Glycine soja TaxID=3848 RepID=UPI00103B2C49|nr:uncharacterized protein LOC114408320 [Glycine soja]
MASLITPAHVSNKKPLHLSSWKAKRVRCAVSPPTWREGLRTVSLSLVISHLLLIPNRTCLFHRFFFRMVMLPKQILSISMLREKTLEGEEPQFTLCRSPSRSGPAASLRVNIRAGEGDEDGKTKPQTSLVVQYAFDSGNGKTAFNDVDECLRSLEELDSLLLHASRNDPEASVKSMKTKINSALGALDSLLQTVPSDVLSKGEVIADSYREPEDEETGSLDPDLKQLESIL